MAPRRQAGPDGPPARHIEPQRESGGQFPHFADEKLAALSVFASSMAMVMGPTPPGTGVTADAT